MLVTGLTPANSDTAGNAASYIADSDYLSYRHELVREALNDPTIKMRLKSARTPQEINETLKRESLKKNLEFTEKKIILMKTELRNNRKEGIFSITAQTAINNNRENKITICVRLVMVA